MPKTRAEINWTEAQTKQALEIWAEYQRKHDVSGRTGQAAGIDPATGRIWFGTSAAAVRHELDAAGVDTPLLFIRVGSDCYVRKGGRKSWLVM